MSKPKISVLMPVYNAERFLSIAIESILKQSLNDFEFIIVDDGSNDNSFIIIKHYSNIDARISYYTQKNSGISFTRNRLVNLANTELIAWMDADDISESNRLLMQYDFLRLNQDYVAVGTSTMMIDEDGDEITEWHSPLSHIEIDRHHLEGKGGAIIFPSSMMRKSIVQGVGGFNEDLTGAEDLCLFLRLAEVGHLANLNQPLFFYRQHIKSICHSNSPVITINNLSVINECKRRRGAPLASISLYNTGAPAHQSKINVYMKWGWWALSAGNLKTARKYAVKTLVTNPFRTGSWKLFICCLRGY